MDKKIHNWIGISLIVLYVILLIGFSIITLLLLLLESFEIATIFLCLTGTLLLIGDFRLYYLL